MEFKIIRKSMPYDVTIHQVCNGGYVLGIGCEKFVYSRNDVEILISNLAEYMQDPQEMVRIYHKESCKAAGTSSEPPIDPTTMPGLNVRNPEPPVPNPILDDIPWKEKECKED